MRCERFLTYVTLLLVAGCSRSETPAPPSSPLPTSPTPSRSSQPSSGSYADALAWFKSTPGFHFVITDNGVRAEGDMVRPTVGAERVRLTVDGAEWLGVTRAQGIVWYQPAWKEAAPPPFAGHLFQRVTLAFDPQKKEGDAQLVEPGHYRFTDANSGNVHDVWVKDARIERIRIGKVMEMTITRPDQPGDVPNVGRASARPTKTPG